MPNYFFHVRDHGLLIEDRVGLNLPDLGFVLGECRNMIQGVLHEEEWQDILDADRKFEIVDRRGRVVLTVPFNELDSDRTLLPSCLTALNVV
jgi:hypothetical protein